MAKGKIEDEPRIFQDSWEMDFFCISGNTNNHVSFYQMQELFKHFLGPHIYVKLLLIN